MTRNDADSEDLRVKRTYKLLQEALIELTVQKGFSAVAVSDITKYAGVNRATFYRHYEDKFDLLNHYARTVYKLLDSMPDAGLPMPTDIAARPVGSLSTTYRRRCGVSLRPSSKKYL